MASQHMNVVLMFVGFYLALFGLPFVVALPVAGAIVLLWRDPPRILVLRPFNRRPLTRDLARVVRGDVARFGHVYTLADAELRVRWYVRVPFLLGQLALLSFRSRIDHEAASVETARTRHAAHLAAQHQLVPVLAQGVRGRDR